MFNKKFFTKILLSALIFLGVLEILLRANGFIYLKVQEFHNKRIITKGEQYVIMCLGDSNTSIGGEDSYPSQLEKILNERVGSTTFKVLNKGLPAANSTIILKEVEAWIKEYKPNMVTAMMGANDRYDPQALKDQKSFSFLNIFQVSKLFKGLGVEINNHVREKFKQKPKEKTFKQVPEEYGKMFFYAMSVKASGDCETAEKIFYSLANIPGIEGTFQLRASDEARECFYHRKEYVPLMWALDIALRENPYNVESIDIIRDLAKKGEAKELVIGLLTKLTNDNPKSMPLIGLLGACYAQYGMPEMAEVYINKLETMRNGGEVLPLKANYIALNKMLRDHHIQPVFIQYPMRDVNVLKRMLKLEKDYERIIFIDNQPSFQEALQPTRYYDYFKDRNYDDLGHCTPKGDRIIASNIADAILKHLKYQTVSR